MICSKLLDYNLVDVEGLVLLNEQWGLIEDQFEQAQLVVGPPDDGIYASKLHDHDMLRDYRGKFVFNTKYQDWEREKIRGKKFVGNKFILSKDLGDGKFINELNVIDKEGGYVPPKLRAGTFEWVCVLDFNKQYPNAIMSSNAGLRTAIDIIYESNKRIYGWTVDINTGYKALMKFNKDDLIETPVAYFRKDIQSINKSKFEKWLVFRKEAQKKASEYLEKVKDEQDPFYKLLDGKQFRIKIFTNGGFGIMGFSKDRNYSKLIFNNATTMCQDLTKKMITIIKRLGYDIVGGDTDSCFPKLKSDSLIEAIVEAHWLTNMINMEIDDYLDEVYNIQDHTMRVSVETISDKFLVKEQKNYVKRNLYADGVILNEAKLEVKGIEMKKRNTSRLAADMQETIIKILLDSPTIPEDFNLLMMALDRHIDGLPWEYIAPKGAINNELSDYAPGNMNARGARNGEKFLRKNFQPGDNPFIMPFKVFPKKIHGNFVSPYNHRDDVVVSFDEEDIQTLKDLGFIPNFEEIKRTQIHLKSKKFLDLVKMDFYDSIDKIEMSDDMEL